MRLFVWLLAFAGLSSLASAAPLYTECPAVGANSGCAVLITVDASGTATASIDKAQGPYDGSDDTLIGVLNNSSNNIGSLPLSGGDIFGFDGDGICSSAYGVAGNCSKGLQVGDPYDYAGDFVTFTVTDYDNGFVNFVGGLAPGQSSYFSLEEAPGVIAVGAPSPVAASPEPASMSLLGGSSLLLFGLARLKGKGK